MKCKVKNNSSLDMTKFMPLLSSFLPYAKKTMGFNRPPSLFFTSDAENAEKPLGKTAFYEPDELKITIFVDKRHPKDIMRSLSHELVHHAQNCRGDFTADLMGETGKGYAQNNDYLREMEREAYEKGNLTFRDWEDTHKKQLQESIYYTRGDNSKMSYKKWRNQEVNSLLMESWGFDAPKNEISHLCAMLVTEKATGRVGHPINHTLLEGGVVTHYDVEFDDVIVEGMPVSALDVEVQEEHMHGRREDYAHDEDKLREKYMEEDMHDDMDMDLPDIDMDTPEMPDMDMPDMPDMDMSEDVIEEDDLSITPSKYNFNETKKVNKIKLDEELIRKIVSEAIKRVKK